VPVDFTCRSIFHVLFDFGVLAGLADDDELSVLLAVVLDDDELSLLDDDPVSFEAEPPDVDPSVVDEPLVAESLDVLDSDFADFLSRLSVLKKPEPLKVTPTGVKTFLTGRTSPDWGWATSVRVASVNACWTSIVSPVSTNL